jgi:hypothetical protein
MLDMLTGAYQRRDLQNAKKGAAPETNIGKLFYLIAEGYEIIHENAELVREWDDLDNAEGAVLDRYGANFGVARGGASDALYRIFIRVKMIAQLSGGDDETIIKAAGELLGVEFTDLEVYDVFPAKKAIYVDQDLLTDERVELIEQIAYAIKRTLLAGVGLRLYLRTYRTYTLPLNIGFGGAVGVEYTALPVPKDREASYQLNVSHAAFARPDFEGNPVGVDKSFVLPSGVAHSAFVGKGLYGAPPDTERPYKASEDAERGAYYHTHIRPRRID